MVGFFIALLSGALMSIQGVFNTEVTKTTGMWVGNAWVQLTAFAVCLIAWLIELLGLFGVDKEPLEWRKVIGMGIALIGIAIFQWK